MTTLDPSYQLVEDGTAIRCLLCRQTSRNPHDVENRYCGRCHRWHERPVPLFSWLADPVLAADTERARTAEILGRPPTGPELAELSRWHHTMGCEMSGLAAAAADKAAREVAEAERRAAEQRPQNGMEDPCPSST